MCYATHVQLSKTSRTACVFERTTATVTVYRCKYELQMLPGHVWVIIFLQYIPLGPGDVKQLQFQEGYQTTCGLQWAIQIRGEK